MCPEIDTIRKSRSPAHFSRCSRTYLSLTRQHEVCNTVLAIRQALDSHECKSNAPTEYPGTAGYSCGAFGASFIRVALHQRRSVPTRGGALEQRVATARLRAQQTASQHIPSQLKHTKGPEHASSFHQTDVRDLEHGADIVDKRRQPAASRLCALVPFRIPARRPGLGPAVPTLGSGSRVRPLTSLVARRPGTSTTRPDNSTSQSTDTAASTPAQPILLLGRAPCPSPHLHTNTPATPRAPGSGGRRLFPPKYPPQQESETLPGVIRKRGALVAAEQHGRVCGCKAAVVDGRAPGEPQAAEGPPRWLRSAELHCGDSNRRWWWWL